MITLLVAVPELAAAEVTVAGDAYRHLFRARRLAAGARLRLTDGAGRARWAEVARVGRGAATLVLGEAAPAGESRLRLELLVATLRPERATWLVEKATELGVAAVRFIHSERAPRELRAGALDRLRRVATAALEQCHGARLPEISGAHAWEDLPRLTAPTAPTAEAAEAASTAAAAPAASIAAAAPAVGAAGQRWFLDAEAVAGWPQPGAPGGEPVRQVALLVGPEGGWTAAERAALAGAGWRPAGLGERTLRIETAAIAGAALLLLPHPARAWP